MERRVLFISKTRDTLTSDLTSDDIQLSSCTFYSFILALFKDILYPMRCYEHLSIDLITTITSLYSIDPHLIRK